MHTDIHFINREISWLSFNERVLQESSDVRVPLIERMRFLGIFSNNQDEFFRVRIATLNRLLKIEKKKGLFFEYPIQDLLTQIQKIIIVQQKNFQHNYQTIRKSLEKKGIFVVNERELDVSQKAYLYHFYKDTVEPLMVPIMVKNAPKFPYLKDKSIYLFVSFNSQNLKKQHYSLIEIPSHTLSRFIVIPSEGKTKYIIYLDDVIRLNLPQIFSIFKPEKIEAHIIKITRDAELDLDEDILESYYDKLRKSLERRKKGAPVRFIYDQNMPVNGLHYLLNKMKLSESNTISGGRYHNFKDFMQFPNVGNKNLEYPTQRFIPVPFLTAHNGIFEAIKKKDVLLHFPYQSFDYVIDMLREAAIDPSVSSIKITLYRLASDSKIINALINAVKNGKDVLVIMELQARFDEEANLQWSKILTDEGVQVVFGISGLKIHSKLILIERKVENHTLKYVYLGTGNFHEGTARKYSDTALLTCDPRISEDVEMVFNFLVRPYLSHQFKHLLISPTYMRPWLDELIEKEINNAVSGKIAYMKLKMNSLVDHRIIERLYTASTAGVKIDLIIRGTCSLVPGIKGVSENITAVSILDKYLEHSRIFVFANGGKEKVFISSADWMPRNLDLRVEVTAPIYSKSLKKEINDFLYIQLNDNTKAREFDLQMSNNYVTNKKKPIRAQEAFYKYLEKKTTVR
jgi:polyphosphate kinase